MMNFNELALTLPNGFHDSELKRFVMDYFHRTLELDLDVWVGDMRAVAKREIYRPARVTLVKVAFLVVEPPDARYAWLGPGRIRVDSGEGFPLTSSSIIPSPPAGISTTYIYLGELNSFLHFAAAEALLEWIGPEQDRAGRNI